MDVASNVSAERSALPPGQRELKEFPRFGIVSFAKHPIRGTDIRIEVSGAFERPIVLTANELAMLPRVTLRRDFHCAAGWSYRELEWSGYRFADVWTRLIVPHAQRVSEHALVVLRGEDRFRTSLPLADLLVPEVVIADRLNGELLSIEHGAPVRLIAPAHYGYKSVKHLARIELHADDRGYRPLLPRLLDHPRARVAFEERGELLPGWLSRYLFRPFVQPIIRKLRRISESQGLDTE